MTRPPEPQYSSVPSPQEEHAPADRDVEFLLETIRDYSDQLRLQIEKSETFKIQIGSNVSIAGAGSAVFSVAASLFAADSTAAISPLIMAVALISGLVLLGGFSIMIVQGYRRNRTARYEVERLSNILGHLVRRASQFLDRGDVVFGQRVLMDIILSDAEHLIGRATHRNSKIGLLVRA